MKENENLTFKQKLLELQKKIKPVKKDTSNPFFKSTYADLNDILAEVKEHMNELRLVLHQPVVDGCVVTFIIDVDSDSELCSTMKLPEGIDPQKIGSAVTYYRRYTLKSLLALEDTDDDGNTASQEVTQSIKSDPAVNGVDYASKMQERRTVHAQGDCPKCGAPMATSKAGALYCSKKCWLNPPARPIANIMDLPPPIDDEIPF